MSSSNIILDLIDATRGILDFSSVINIILKRIKTHTGFSAIGIRIVNDIGDYPYYVYTGFSDEFMQTENSLCQTDKDGNIVRDPDGNPTLGCMCGNIIQRRFDPKLPFFTEGGSFWSNGTSKLLASTTEKERQSQTRNKCNGMGYESVGLFPLDIGSKNLGILQLNDKREGMFSAESVREYELLARYIAGVIHSTHTIKKLKETEEELDLQAWGLQKANEGIRVLYHEVEKLAQVKSEFTSMVSHELRTPLTTIKESIDLVMEGLAGDINDKQREFLDMAKNNTDRLARLINDILDFQKIESGKMRYDVRENNVNEVALEIYKSMTGMAKEKGLDIAIELDDDLPKIRFDRDRIVQVLTNLLNNAIKFTEKGAISISSRRDDNLIHVMVRDTGPGIKAEDMPKLFQTFEQLDGGKKKGGTGLGLAISKEIILAHKGKIWAESKLGKGTTFHFTLPIKERRG